MSTYRLQSTWLFLLYTPSSVWPPPPPFVSIFRPPNISVISEYSSNSRPDYLLCFGSYTIYCCGAYELYHSVYWPRFTPCTHDTVVFIISSCTRRIYQQQYNVILYVSYEQTSSSSSSSGSYLLCWGTDVIVRTNRQLSTTTRPTCICIMHTRILLLYPYLYVPIYTSTRQTVDGHVKIVTMNSADFTGGMS